MLNTIIDHSLRNRLFVLLISLVLILAGIAVVNSMDVDVFPDLTAPTVTVMTEAHGMEAEEVERLVTYQIETGLNGSPHVRRIRSSSAAGISIVWVEFDWGTDIFLARQLVSEKLPAIQDQLPLEVGEPTLTPVSSIMGEIMLLGIISDSIDPMALRTLSDWEILPRLKAIQGIANVVVIGGEFKQYQILASPGLMDYYGVSLEELMEAAEASNANSSGGFFAEHGNRYSIKGEGRIRDLADISRALVKRIDGKPVRIGDVAEVRLGAADKIGDASMNTEPAVVMTLTKQPGTNTLELTRRIDEVVEEMQANLPGDVQIDNHVFRQADFIQASIDNLRSTILEGAFFVILVLIIFLMNWRTTVISLVAIPMSLLVTVIVLALLDFSINTMSLGGMAIAIGALVDDAIIDVENVFKRLRQNAALPRARQQPVLQIVAAASKEIRPSIIIATLIVIVAFIPLFLLSGMEGRLLKPLGIAFIVSVLTSLIVAVSLTPVLCSYLLASPRLLARGSTGTATERLLQHGYRDLLSRIIRYPKTVVLVAALGFAGSALLIPGLGRSFLPEFNEGSLVISIVGPPGISLEEKGKIGVLAEELLLGLDEIDAVTRRTGRAELDEHAQGVNSSEIEAPFTLKGKSRSAFLAEVREALSVIPGVNITIGQPIAHRIDHMLSGTRANIAIKVFGEDLPTLFSVGKGIVGKIEGLEGLADVAVEQQIEVPQIRIKPGREMLAQYGLTTADFSEFVAAAFAGATVSQVYEGHRSFDMVVRYDESVRGDIERMRNALVSLPDGGSVPLADIAELQSVSSPYSVNRENVHRKVVVSANVSSGDLRGAVQRIRKVVDEEVTLPEGYRVEYGGQFESEARASRLLLLASLAAILIIFALLYAEFRDLRLAGIVLINLPLALIGGVLIVELTSGIISIASTIGFISLFGIATRNGILLISRYQALEHSGDTSEIATEFASDFASGSRGKASKTQADETALGAILQGSVERLNPILMTALTTALALIPLALKGDQPGNEIQSPMAIVILGGLLTATVLNLLVIPCVYRLVKRI